MPIRLIVGLGNPGETYRRTRHNIGFRVVEAWARRQRATWKSSSRFHGEISQCDRRGSALHLLKPATYMNESGRAVGALASFHRIPPEEIVVIYDEFQIPTGRCKLSIGGGAGGHNGIADLLSHCGDRFVRYRIGIGAPKPPQMALKDFVLGRFSTAEELLLEQAIATFLDGLDLVVDTGPVLAMNQINNRQNPIHECEHSQSI